MANNEIPTGPAISHTSPRNSVVRETTPTSLLIESLKPQWKPNDVIRLFREERTKIDKRRQECKQLLSETNSVLKEAMALKDLYMYVSPKTSQLHSECKNIIQERNDLKESFEKINFTLSKKEELRSIFKRMPEIKNQVYNLLNSVCQNFQTRTTEQSNQPAELTPLDEYYSKFFVECRRIKDLTGQLESCVTSANTEELTIYLEDIYGLYVDIREQMMEPVFSKNVEKLVSRADRNYCDLMQHSCASLVRILRSEIQLFHQIFPSQTINDGVRTHPNVDITSTTSSSSTATSNNNDAIQQQGLITSAGSKGTSQLKKTALNELLSSLCKTFHEHLRPVIIRINHLVTLAELYKLVNETMRLEVSDDCFQSTMSLLAGDIQERLVFRTEIFKQESIIDYNPSRGDLAYPEKFDLVPGGELRDYQSMWYPTVQRTVLALHYLNRVLDQLTFRELAQELLTACYRSLDLAQHKVDELHGCTKVEASVFMSKHSAILIDQMQFYGIDQSQLPPPPPLMAAYSPDDRFEQPKSANFQAARNKQTPPTRPQPNDKKPQEAQSASQQLAASPQTQPTTNEASSQIQQTNFSPETQSAAAPPQQDQPPSTSSAPSEL